MTQSLSDFVSQTPMLLIALCAGTFIGFIFFGGLWWTVKKIQLARHTGLLFFASFLTRMVIVVYGIYYIGDGQWQRLAAYMSGFLLARFAVIRLTDSIAENIVINDASVINCTNNDQKEKSRAS